MELKLLDNTIIEGVRYVSGEVLDLPDDVANRLKQGGLADCVAPPVEVDEPDVVEPKPEKKRTTRKSFSNRKLSSEIEAKVTE